MAKNAIATPLFATMRENANTTALIRQLKQLGEDATKPLTKKEEQAMIKRLKKDPDELRKQLVLHNIRYAIDMATKYCNRGVNNSFDEVCAWAISGFCYAATKFDLKKGTKFGTYATAWIRKYMMHNVYYNPDEQVSATSISLDSVMRTNSSKDDGNNSAEMSNFIDDQIDPSYNRAISNVEESVAAGENKTLFDQIRDFMKGDTSFTKQDTEIFNRMIFENMTARQISADLGITRKEVEAAEETMMGKFRQFLKDKMNITKYDDLMMAGV